MKRVLVLVIVGLFVLWVGSALAADEVVIEEIQTEVTETKAKADGNNSRIQALELKDVEHEKRKAHRHSFDVHNAHRVGARLDQDIFSRVFLYLRLFDTFHCCAGLELGRIGASSVSLSE